MAGAAYSCRAIPKGSYHIPREFSCRNWYVNAVMVGRKEVRRQAAGTRFREGCLVLRDFHAWAGYDRGMMEHGVESKPCDLTPARAMLLRGATRQRERPASVALSNPLWQTSANQR